MTIISHRGYWKTREEKNTAVAFERSFALGFGTETDFRDWGGQLVIEHDLPNERSLEADACFASLARHNASLPLAINIKADGLQHLLKAALTRYGIQNYFLFDMSVPDAVFSLKQGLRVFTRHSDMEPSPAFYAQAAGVWMDAFADDSWLTPAAVVQHLQRGKEVCLVSPELHGRPHLEFWQRMREAALDSHGKVTLCTDLPEAAQAYFHA